MLRRWFAICGVVVGAVVASRAEPASNVVQYTHDAVGNIVAVQRINPAPITLSAFSPLSGSPGTTVTITGTGFNSTVAQNAVSFNGASAPVAAASPTVLTVTVPTGAVTGKVAVTVAAITVASAQDFVVTAAGAPTITGFSPAAGAVGAVVTVTGTNFDSVPGATTVKLNQSPPAATAVTGTTLSFAVPSATGSGRIMVSTAGGSSVSATDFVIPPGGISPTDVLATTRLDMDGPARSMGLYATNKFGLVLFDGAAGDWISLHFANFTITPASSTIGYTIYKPDNSQLASGTLTATNLSVHPPALPMSGTYALLLRTGLAQVSLDAKVETNRFVPTDVSSLHFTRTVGQSTRTLIGAVAGEQKAFMVAGLSTTPANGWQDIQILLPNGSTFRRANAIGLGTTTALPPFPVTGTYAVLLAPTAGTRQSAYKVALLGGSTLAIDGSAADVAMANPGEAARLTFAGVAGDNLGLGVSGVSPSSGAGASTAIAAYKPDGSLLTTTVCGADGTRCAINLESLPVSGSYSLIVQPVNGATGAQRVWLSRDVAGALVSGTPLVVALPRPGQNARVTFAGTAGSSVALQVRGVTTSPPGQGMLVLVYRPDKSSIAYVHLTGAGQTLVTPPLPVTGTYTVYVEPEPAAQAAATASMEVLLDPGRALEIDGATQSAALGVAGASARFTFFATAGQNLGLGIGNVALAPTTDSTATVYKPDGSQLTSWSCAASVGACGSTLLNLPITGTYGVVFRPLVGATGYVSATLSSDLTGALVVGGPAVTLSLDRLGRNARLTFAGIAGQTLRIAWTGSASAPGYTMLTVTSPAAATVAQTNVASTGSATYDIPALPATGTYTLFIDPPASVTLGATVRITAR